MNQNEQKIQEEEYSFPYHYIPSYTKNFTQTVNWTWGIKYISAIEFVIDKINQESHGSIIDIGCGDGRLTKELSEKLPNIKITGIDYSLRAINIARALNPTLDFKNIDIIKQEISEKYDVATLIEVFEHIPVDQHEKFVKSVASLIQPDGLLYLTVPHKNKPLNPKHFKHFDSKSIKEHFEEYFEVKEIIFIDKKTKLNKIISLILTNKLFILNNQKIKNILYYIYKKLCLITQEDKCLRLFVKFKRK